VNSKTVVEHTYFAAALIEQVALWAAASPSQFSQASLRETGDLEQSAGSNVGVF